MADKKTDTKETKQEPAPAPAAAPPKAKPTKPTAPEGYELVDWTFGHRIVAGKHGTIDLRKLSPARAGQLVDAGFKYLKRK